MNLPPLKDEHLLKWGFLILKKKSSRAHRLGDAPPDGGGCSLSHNKQHINPCGREHAIYYSLFYATRRYVIFLLVGTGSIFLYLDFVKMFAAPCKSRCAS